jgi:signal transduction histidine kinase
MTAELESTLMSPGYQSMTSDASKRVKPSPGPAGLHAAATAAAYLLPPAVAAASAGFAILSWSPVCESGVAKLVVGTGLMLVGLAAGAFAGRAASNAERRALTREYEQRFDDLDHDLRSPTTIIRGEVELVLSQEDIPVEERGRSSAAVIEQLERHESLLRRRCGT